MESRDKPFIRALKGETLDTPPMWLMRQAGRYLPEYREVRKSAGSFLDLCYSPDLATEVTLQPLRRYDFDAAIIFSDILVIPHALGQGVRFEEGKGPILDAIASSDELAAFEPEPFHDHMAPVYEALGKVRSGMPETTALIGFAGAPWTVATYMIEGGTSRAFEKIKSWALGRPDDFAKVIDILVDSTADYLIRQIEAGAEAVQIFDTWSGILSETAFARWCVEPVAEIRRRVGAAHPDIPVIGFPRGAGVQYEGFAKRTGMNAVTLDFTVPPGWARDHVQTECCVQGNLDPFILAAGGAAMENELSNILGALRGGPYVFNLGHGILPHTPPDHVARLVEIVRGGSR